MMSHARDYDTDGVFVKLVVVVTVNHRGHVKPKRRHSIDETRVWMLLLKCCFTSTETVGLSRTRAQDVHLDFHTAPEL